MAVFFITGRMRRERVVIWIKVEGRLKVLISDLSDNKKIVRFGGRSQLYSSFDFGSLLGDYSIFAIARHAGGENESVISSVGSD